MDLFVHYDEETGLEPDIFLLFDDPSDTIIDMVEGTGTKERRYVVTLQDVIDSGLEAGNWNATVRVGDRDYPADAEIRSVFNTLRWSGSDVLADASGGGTLSARIGIVSLSTSDILEIVQGEARTLTFIVEAHGRFNNAVATNITVKMADTEGTTITKTEDGAIERVCQALDVQVLRCLLTAEETASLVDGLLQIEISFDSQKARLTHSLKVIDQIVEEGS